MVTGILTPLFPLDDILQWFIVQPTICPRLVAVDARYKLLEWFANAMRMTYQFKRPATFQALQQAGLRLWSFEPITILLGSSLAGAAIHLLDFPLAFVPTKFDWQGILDLALTSLLGVPGPLIERIVELGTFDANLLQIRIWSVDSAIKALKNAYKKKSAIDGATQK